MAISGKNMSKYNEVEYPKSIFTSKKNENILVVGATGLIGDSVLSYLKLKGYSAYGTTRNRNINNVDLLYLNLDTTEHEISFADFSTVIICAAITKLEEYKNNPEYCELVNVTNTISLINQCIKVKCFVIFISSNAVFDGKKQFYNFNDNPNPISRYGQSKLIVEKYIESLKSANVCIIRLTKVIKDKMEFINNLKVPSLDLEGEIKAFRNRFISPLTINEVNSALELLTKKKKPGIFQLGGYEEISYYDFVKRVLRENRIFQGNIVETICTDPDITIHNSLKTFLPSL
jgi:dTDP-4-dehydrorhamnose reductase